MTRAGWRAGTAGASPQLEVYHHLKLAVGNPRTSEAATGDTAKRRTDAGIAASARFALHDGEWSGGGHRMSPGAWTSVHLALPAAAAGPPRGARRSRSIGEIRTAAGLDQPGQRTPAERPAGRGHLNPAASRFIGSRVPPPPAAIATGPFLGRVEAVQPIRQRPRPLTGGCPLLRRHRPPLPRPRLGIEGLARLRILGLGCAPLDEPRRQ